MRTARHVTDLTRPGGVQARVWQVPPHRHLLADGTQAVTTHAVTVAHVGRVTVWPCDPEGVVAEDAVPFGAAVGSDHEAALRAAWFEPETDRP